MVPFDSPSSRLSPPQIHLQAEGLFEIFKDLLFYFGLFCRVVILK